MDKQIRKSIQFGLGVLDITREKVEEFVEDLGENIDVHTREGRKIVNSILKDAEKARKKLDKKIEKKVQEALDKSDLATKKDIKRLEKKLDKLLKDKN